MSRSYTACAAPLPVDRRIGSSSREGAALVGFALTVRRAEIDAVSRESRLFERVAGVSAHAVSRLRSSMAA